MQILPYVSRLWPTILPLHFNLTRLIVFKVFGLRYLEPVEVSDIAQ